MNGITEVPDELKPFYTKSTFEEAKVHHMFKTLVSLEASYHHAVNMTVSLQISIFSS